MRLIIGLYKGIGNGMRRQYPSGRWVTIRGRHVYIKKNGEIAPETKLKFDEGGLQNDQKAKEGLQSGYKAQSTRETGLGRDTRTDREGTSTTDQRTEGKRHVRKGDRSTAGSILLRKYQYEGAN